MQSANPLYMAMYELPYVESRPESPGSPVERLLAAVDAHARAESESLAQYEHIAEASGDPVIALVMRLILDDEERHHGLLRRIEATLVDALNWTHSPDALPAGTSAPLGAKELAALTHELVDEEHTGARFLRKLAEQQRGIDGGLPSLLIDSMAMDSEKHARLLQFVQHRLEQNARS